MPRIPAVISLKPAFHGRFEAFLCASGSVSGAVLFSQTGRSEHGVA